MHGSGIVQIPLNFVVYFSPHTMFKILCSNLDFIKTNIKNKLSWIQRKNFLTVQFIHRYKQVILKLIPSILYFHNCQATQRAVK